MIEVTSEQIEKIMICASTPSDHSDPMLPTVMRTMRELCDSHESLRRDAERYRKMRASIGTRTWDIRRVGLLSIRTPDGLDEFADAMESENDRIAAAIEIENSWHETESQREAAKKGEV